MENKDTVGNNHQDLLLNFGDSPSQVRNDTAEFLRRETDSMDDFEHLEHDNHQSGDVMTEKTPEIKQDDFLASLARAENEKQLIDTVLDRSSVPTETFDVFKLEADKKATENLSLFDSPAVSSETVKSVSKIDDLLGDLGQAPPIPPHADILSFAEDKGLGDGAFQVNPAKTEIQHFMDMEKQDLSSQSPSKKSDIADRFSDSEPEIDDFKPSNESYQKPDDFLPAKTDTFKDFITEPEPPLPEKDYLLDPPASSMPKSVPISEAVTPPVFEPTFVPEPVKVEPKPVKEEPKPVKEEPKPAKEEPKPFKEEPKLFKEEPKPAKEEPKPAKSEPVIQKTPVELSKPATEKTHAKEAMGAEVIFCKMGLGKFIRNQFIALFHFNNFVLL